jgi:RHS repeat-associated protein
MQSLGGLGEVLAWNHRDELASYFVGTGEATYYQYDASGQRVRKYSGANDSNYSETIYLGGFEVVSNVSGGDDTRLETLYVSDGQSRVCTVERKTWVDGSPSSSPVNWRYQVGNHLGSASVELDEAGEVISYEEYHPYGSTSYRSHRPGGANLSLKRYRFTGKERDDESGLYYHGARYYAAWLGRWTAADPIGIGDGLNRFAYVRGNPIILNDPSGNASEPIDTKNFEQVSQALNSAILKFAEQNPGTEVQLDVSQSKDGEIAIRVRLDGFEAYNGPVSELAANRGPSTRELIDRAARQSESDANTERLDGNGNVFTNAGREQENFTAGLSVMTEGGFLGQLGYRASKAAGLSEEQAIAGGQLFGNATAAGAAAFAVNRQQPKLNSAGLRSWGFQLPRGRMHAGAPRIDGIYPSSKVAAPKEGIEAASKPLAGSGEPLAETAKAAPQLTQAQISALKNQLFLKGLDVGATGQRAAIMRVQEAISRFRSGVLEIPQGLTRQHLVDYRNAALSGISKAEGKPAGELAGQLQGLRIQLIDEILNSGVL